jgi:2-haloacid dehalogenase
MPSTIHIPPQGICFVKTPVGTLVRVRVAFDANGTLFALEPIERLLGRQATEAFFQRTLHTAAVVTLAGLWAPFEEVARRALATTCATLELDVDQEAALAALRELPPQEGAREAVELAAGCAIVTNGGRDSTAGLVDRAGLRVAEIVSCEEVRAYKPAPAAYRHARDRLGEYVLVAAHGWDVVGARAAGIRAIWVDSGEREWPVAGGKPGERASSLVEAVERALGASSGF